MKRSKATLLCLLLALTASAQDTSLTVTVTDAGWATYIAEDNVDFVGTDVTAYIATGNNETTSVTLTEVQAVEKGTPVIVKAKAA